MDAVDVEATELADTRSSKAVMDVFELHRRVVADYAAYARSFIRIADERIRSKVDEELERGLLWPDPLLQLNPSFEPGASVDELVREGLLHEGCAEPFRLRSKAGDLGRPLRLHAHQEQAIRIARRGEPYVLTTGTGSGKSLAYIIPAVDHVLRNGPGRGVQAVIVYPMNALANSQLEALDGFLKESGSPVTYQRYTGQEDRAARDRILEDPPDIILTNYVMLELILTRVEERRLVQAMRNVRFLVLDELHTYRGRQGADVAMLVRRCREAFSGEELVCVGTSATMTSEGDSSARMALVAEVATKIFGQNLGPDQVVGETLRRATAEHDLGAADVRKSLVDAVCGNQPAPTQRDAFLSHPLAGWIESTLGVRRENATGPLVRQTPRPLRGCGSAAAELAALLRVPEEAAAAALERFLKAGAALADRQTGFPAFAFRLHQFITRGDTVWASLEDESSRHLTLRGQQFVPGDRGRILLPLVFCNCCGHAYYRVDRPKADNLPFVPRERFERTISDELESGYLYLSTEHPWPEDSEEIKGRVPDDWLEEHRGGRRVKSSRRNDLPRVVRLAPDGTASADGRPVAFVRAPFRFCLNPGCDVAYSHRQKTDRGKLSTIGVDGRSTATTILAVSVMLKLRTEASLDPHARKLLSFTDNRQDASLQAGHFNDFVEVGLVRSALYRAMSRVGEDGLRYDDLVHHVERALDLPVEFYAENPEVRYQALEETRRAFRSVLGYFLYRDLERGWRITSPNLEQCGLLEIDYLSLDDVAADEAIWQEKKCHRALIETPAAKRAEVIQTLLDHLRRTLCIKDDALDRLHQERVAQQSRQRLCDPWRIDEIDAMVPASVAWPRSQTPGEWGDDVYISALSNFGLYLRRVLPVEQSIDDTQRIIRDLFGVLSVAGLVEEVRRPGKDSDVPGYQLPSSAMRWRAGDGTKPAVDRLRTTRESQADTETNKFFVSFYKAFAAEGLGLEAREHTAQVDAQERIDREHRFRAGDLPILFCSPTMELGIDIAQLNVVNMRNVPPTPANYAQRSGRAGRSGQPALVYTYCSGLSPHDQYFFRMPERMVAGSVTAPRIDLLNQDLIRSHVHAIWLAEAGLDLGQTLADVLQVSEEDLSLPLTAAALEKLSNPDARRRALRRAQEVLNTIGDELAQAPWYRDDWLDDALERIPQAFEEACGRWRNLYKSAVQQRHAQNKIIGDRSRSEGDRRTAKMLRAQAESQIELLVNPRNVLEGDFYSYRYFASEGFLPGYNFPRLPLSAYIPARRLHRGRDEFLSRPRFIAISEFGPQALIYHEGSIYRVNKVNLAFDAEGQEVIRATMKACSRCGHGHMVTNPPGPNVCESCGELYLPTDEVRELVRLQNVSAKRINRITSDEEERQRMGYEIRTSYRFSEHDGRADVRLSEVVSATGRIATIRYGDATRIWRVNMGWSRRRTRSVRGFNLDLERGYWESNKEIEEADADDPMSPNVRRVVPYVEDHRNAMTIRLDVHQSLSVMATLQAALRQAILLLYQLEPDELAAEALPSSEDRRVLFLFEASEGGAGVLRQLVEDPAALPRVARTALEICHFEPDTGEDRGGSVRGGEGCEAGCYDCLLDYTNQPDHRLIDRKAVAGLLRELATATVVASAGSESRFALLDRLNAACDSILERNWLHLVNTLKLRLPSHAQRLITECHTRADFYYESARTAIYIDGPHHDDPAQRQEDSRITEHLTEAGHLVIRFHHEADWEEILDRYPDIFGQRRPGDVDA